jgi:predicted nucleic-acid-binding protein
VLGVDTNVLVRFFVADDPEQFELARALVAGAGQDGLFVNVVVLAELYWVLDRAYHKPKADILAVIEGLLEFREFIVDQRDLVLDALAAVRATNADFPDALIGMIDAQAGCDRTVTFDKTATRLPQMIAVKEVLT